MAILNSQQVELALPSGSVVTQGVLKLSEKQERIGLRRAQLCEDLHRFRQMESSQQAKQSLSSAITAYLELYNAGAHQSVIHASLGDISASTLRRWYNLWLAAGRDWRALMPGWKSGNVGHTVPQEDFNWLLGILHSDGMPPVASAIKWWHVKLRMEGREQPVSDRTMQRAISVYAQAHAGRWAYMRRGAKYFRENYLPYVFQDHSKIFVGDLWYSDGCLLNFDVINPYTGKGCRPLLVTFMDYASRMIPGFDLDFSENRRVIASAYRNAITLWKFVPLYIKWDNGRAYKSLQGEKMSREEREQLRQRERDEIAEISGNIYATGVLEILNSLPYNPTGKAFQERFYGTLDSGLERFLPGYRGNSISNKPAHLARNEKHLQELHEKRTKGIALTVMEAKILIEWWILDVYGMEPHEGIGGRKPLELWQEGLQNIDASRRRNPDELWYLMLSQEVKKLDRSGVKVRGLWYYDEALFDYVGRKVYVRYDQMDERYVFVYDELKQPICRAMLRHTHDPLATVRGSEDERMRYTAEMKQKARLEKRVKRDAELLQEFMQEGGMFMQEAIAKLQDMKAKGQLTNIGYEIPEIPDASAEKAAEKEEEPEAKAESDVVIPREFLDAIGVS
ncbi:MAG: transposase family protein [Candidatus Cloacimonetes bacterium]|nr:transposase family protein [Candidatus Cloacimonadota bacterium]